MPSMPTTRTVVEIFAGSPDDHISIRQLYDHFLKDAQHVDQDRIRHRIRSIVYSLCMQRRIRRTGRGAYISRSGFIRMHGGCVLTPLHTIPPIPDTPGEIK